MNYNNNNNKICKDIIDTDNINIDIHELTSSIYDDEHLTLAIHGNTFEKLYHLNQQYLNTKSIIVHNNNNKYTKYHHIFKYIIHYCSIYANMSPEHKAMLIQSLQHEHQTVLMCGNNINDYNALKCADVSYTFHSNEHISCVSSFQSLTPNISALPTLLKESKACLVTTIQMLKYIIIFSLIQSISTILLHSKNSYQTTLQFLTSDLFIICPLSLLLPYTQTYPSLTKYQPSSNFISFPIIISICLNSICVLICQIGFIYLKRFMFIIENAYDINLDKCNINIKGGIVPCYVNTGLFFISTIQYILFAFVFSISKPFRKPIYTNYPLLIYLIGVLVYTALMLFYNNKVTPSEMGLLEIKGNEFKIGIASICVVSIIFGLVVEYVVVPWCIKVYNGSGNGKGKEKGKERMMKEIESDIIQEVKNNI
jgi:magnesium-transporting ATPase (P-type)